MKTGVTSKISMNYSDSGNCIDYIKHIRLTRSNMVIGFGYLYVDLRL